MATDNTIVISAELRELTEKQVKKFVTELTKTINTGLSSAAIDFSKVQLKGLDKLATKVAKQLTPALNKALGEITVDASKLKKFAIPVKLDLTGAKAQLAEFAKTNSLSVVTTLTQPKTTVVGGAPPNTPVIPTNVLDQRAIDAATASLKAHRSALLASGLTQKEADKETRDYTTTIKRLQSSLDNANRAQRVSGQLSDSEIKRLQVHKLAAEDLIKTINKLGTAHAQANVEVRRGEAFMESFGFRVGILGFGFGILGGHLQRFSQALTQSVTSGAKLIEPLERIRNLLFQDPAIAEGDRQSILSELNRLADLPGSDLENTAKSFRQLNSIGLELADTLALLEGLIKATGRSGIGAEGVGRLSAQFRQFASSGEFRQQDIRAIAESGGKDVTSIIERAFGGLSPEAIERAGPAKFFQILIAGLKELPTPLDTVTDKLNRMQNAVTRLALSISPLVKPGLDNLVKVLQSLEPLVTRLSEKFASLPAGLQDAISTLLVLTPIIAALVAGIFTLVSALGIGIAAFKQVKDALRDTRGLLLGTETTVGKLSGTVATAGRELTILGAAGTRIGNIFKPVTAIFLTLAASIKAVMAASKNTVGFATGIGAGAGAVAKVVQQADVLAFIAKGSLAAGLTAVSTSLGGILKILPKILGFTGPIGIIINLLLALITNAGYARDVVVDALSGLGESLSKLFAKLGTTGTDVLNTIFNILGAIVTFVGGTLGAVLAGVITQLTGIIDALAAIIEFIQNPSWENFANAWYEIFSAMVEGVGVIGGLIGATILEAIAEAFKDTRLGAILGTDALADTAKTIRENFKNAYNTAPIDNATKSTHTLTSATGELNEELSEAGKLIDELEKSINKLSISYSRMITDLQTKQLKFNLSLQTEQAEHEFDKQALSDPERALQELPNLLQTQTQNALRGIREASANEVKAIGDDLSRTLKTLSSNLFSPQSSLFKFLNTDFVNAFFDLRESLKEVNRLAAAGDITLGSYEKRLAEIKDAGDSLLKSLLGTSFSSDVMTPQGKVSAVQAREQAEKFKEVLGETLGITERIGKALGDQASEAMRITNEAEQTRKQKERELKERIEQIKLETNLLGKQLKLEELQFKLAQEEQRVQEIADRGEETNLATAIDLREKIAALESEIATLRNRTADGQVKDALEEQRIVNEKTLRIEQDKNKASADRLNLLKEQSKVQEEMFRQSLNDLRKYFEDAKKQAVDLSTIPGLGEDFLKKTEARIKQLADLQLSLSTQVRDAEQRVRDGDLVRTGLDLPLPHADIVGRFKSMDINALKVQLTKLTEEAVNLEIQLDKAKQQVLATETSGDNTSKTYREQVITVSNLSEKASSYARVIAFINALLNQQTQTLDEASAAQLRTLERTKAEAEWRQELLELELETLQLVADRARQQAGQGELGLDDALGGIQARREVTQKREIALIREKYTQLKTELEIRRFLLETQMKTANASKADLDAMNALFAARQAILDENQRLETQLIQGQTNIDPFTQKLKDLAAAFRDVFDAARQAREGMADFFNEAASGEFALDALYKGLTEGISATDIVATAFITMGAAIGQALIQALENGENFLDTLGKILGGVLIKIGEMLIQMAVMSVVMAFMWGLMEGGIFLALAWAAAAAPWAAVAAAIGAGLIIAGTAMGGGGKSTSAARANTASGADRSTGAQRNTFEPEKDPRFIFQKTMLARIQLEIKTDDSQIIKAVINGVNQNGRLTRLIGNRKLEFTV